MMNQIIEFVRPYYEKKDMMHDMSHIKRVMDALDGLCKDDRSHDYDEDILPVAVYFHGLIKDHKKDVCEFLQSQNCSQTYINRIVELAQDSLKTSQPSSYEGKLLHDAHMIEGGDAFEIVKSLITGSLRGQSLLETLTYFQNYILNQGRCYTPMGIERYQHIQAQSQEIFNSLCQGLKYDI